MKKKWRYAKCNFNSTFLCTLINCEWLRKLIWIDRQEPATIKKYYEKSLLSKNCTICFNLYMYIHCTYNHLLKQNIQFFLFSFIILSSFPLIILCFIIFFLLNTLTSKGKGEGLYPLPPPPPPPPLDPQKPPSPLRRQYMPISMLFFSG